MIEFSNVSKKYENGTDALKCINLRIEKGEFVFIVGASGAGKSTIIKTLLREEIPTSGTVFVNGVNLVRMKRRHIPKFRRSLGVVFQDFRLIPNLTVYDNVAFSLRVTNVVGKEIRSRVPYVLKLLGLSSKAKCMPDQISGGEQQRVALARALVNNPSIIIADEPTGNIDPELSYEIVNLLSEINEQCGTTIVMVTHEHNLVTSFNKRVIAIEDGMILSDTKAGAPSAPTGDAAKKTAKRPAKTKSAVDFPNKTAAGITREYEKNLASQTYEFPAASREVALGRKI